MDDFTGKTLAFTQYWQGEGDGLIYVAYLHQSKLFYYEQEDDAQELRHRDWTDDDLDRFKRQAGAWYEVADGTVYEGIRAHMDGLLGIKPEPKPEPVRLEAPESIVEAAKPAVRVRRPERDEGQMRLF